MIIGLSGLAGSGKSTVADYLIKEHGYQRIKFADPLKNMLRALGLNEDEIEGHLKEEPCELLSGQTPRYAMQTLGDWGRTQIGLDLWVNGWHSVWKKRVYNHAEESFYPLKIVVDDCRFPNEFEAVKELGGKVLLIERKGQTIKSQHESENALDGFEFDAIIHNTGTIADLHDILDKGGW